MPPPPASPSASFVSRTLARLDADGTRCRSEEASLVFADVSGFTPLTERLAGRGREGSELLTELLNALFGPTLDAALDLGGDLLSFGGDALLIHVGGPDHRARAPDVAATMLDEFSRAARRRRARVEMSVGVASGVLHLHRVGRRSRLLALHGDVVTAVQQLEAAARPGEILGPDGLVRVAADRGEREAAPVPPVGHAGLIDPLVAAAIDRGDPGEHRRAVVAFLRCPLEPVATPDEVAEHLDTLLDAVESACTATSVALLNADIDPLGLKLTLTAGVPFTTGDDADRMLEAVLRIRDALPAEVPTHIGVNEGPVFAGPVGSPRRQAYTVMGDDVNLAARVAGRAPAASVVATAAVVDRARQSFSLDPLPPFTVKGKTKPIRASVVLGHGRGTATAPQAPASASGPGRMHGRDVELARLNALAGAAALGTGALVEIVAPPGLGKSRLTDEFAGSAGLPVLRIEAGRYLAGTAHGAVTAAVRPLLGLDGAGRPDAARSLLEATVRRLAPHLLEWLPLLAVPFGVDVADNETTARVTDEFRRRRAHQLAGELLTRLGGGPRLLVVEDGHWLDEASAELLDSQTERLVEHGWLVLVTRRPEATGWCPTDPQLRLDLEPLDGTAASRLATDLAGSEPLADHVVRRLVARSAGNPLFLQQMVRSVGDGADPDDLPDRVEVLIEARIDRLDDRSRRALRTAAVLGARFAPELLDAVEPGAVETLRQLDEFVVVGGTEVRFLHALFRDTAYVALPARRRRELHALAAAALERRTPEERAAATELLAVHWYEAGAHATAWPYLRAAAARARDDLAPYEALRFLERALGRTARLRADQRSEVPAAREELGILAETLGRYEAAERAFRAARRAATTDADRARLLGLEARVARSARSLTTAGRRFRRALEIAPAEEHRIRADLLVGLSSILERQGRHLDKLPILQEALEEAAASGDTDALAHAHLLLGNTHGDLGDGSAVEHLERALTLFESRSNLWGVASARNNLGVEAYYGGDLDLAVEHYQAAADGYRRIGDEANQAMTLNNIGEIHSDLGAWEEAATELTEAHRMWTAVGFVLGVGLASSNLGRLAARRGRFDEADRHFDEARATLSGIDARGFLLELDARVAAARVAAGRAEEGVDLADRTLAAGDELQPTVRCQLLRTRALGLAAQDLRVEARAAVRQALALARSIDAPQEVSECEATLAELG